jgi:probable F420-dependent oxidoreductase
MTLTRPFRFGVVVMEALGREAWREQAKRAEGLGYDILLAPDHIGIGLPGWPAALMAAADATDRLRIGTYVLDNNFRHPAFVAQDAATLDLLSDGRFELGLGAGWQLDNYTRTGIPWEAPRVRAGRLEEAVAIVKGLLAGETVTFDGDHYQISELPGTPLPVQRPRPPLLIGGGGPRMLALAAREAEIVSVVMSSRQEGGLRLDIDTATVAGKIERVREAAGDRFEQIELNVLLQTVTTTDDRQAAAEALSAAWEIPTVMLLDSPYTLIGSVDEMVETLQRQRKELGITYVSVFERHWEAFNPVVERLAGT